MAKLSTAQKLVANDRIFSAIFGAGVGFSCAAIAVRSDGSITVERFTHLNWIAFSLLVVGLVGGLLTGRQVRKAAQAPS